MLEDSPFNNDSFRDYVLAFGDLFNEISIERQLGDGTVSKTLEVPITYSPKEPFIRRLDERNSISDQTGAKIKRTLPRMGYEITGHAFDPERMLNPMQKLMIENPEDNDQVQYQFAPKPYNIDFSLYIATKNLADGYKILEQILPYFSPSFYLNVNLTDMNYKVSLPLILQSADPDIEYEGTIETNRKIIYTLNFTLKAWMFGPIKTGGIIKEVDVYNRDLNNCGTYSQIETKVDPITAGISDTFNILVTKTVNE